MPTPFTGECRDYRRIEGLLVPHELTAYWHIGGEPIAYARFEVEEMEYNAKATY